MSKGQKWFSRKIGNPTQEKVPPKPESVFGAHTRVAADINALRGKGKN